MATSRRALALTAFVLQMLMVGATASPLAEATNPLGDASKMNTDLVERLDEVNDATVLPVIFQLFSPVTEHDEAYMQQLGMELLGHAPLVDGGLVEGLPSMFVASLRGTVLSTLNSISHSSSSTYQVTGAANPTPES